MALEPISSAPSIESFTPLVEHQSQTPGTFFGGPPVLYHHSPGAKILISRSQYDQSHILHELNNAPTAPNGASESGHEDVSLNGVDIWVTSEKLIIFSVTRGKGVSVSYPAVALHALGSAQSSPAVYLQLNLHDANTNSDEDIQTLDLHVIPDNSDDASSPAKAMFEAMSACADLHPDPASPSSEPEDTVPGAGGWITSENMLDFMDGDGNFTGIGNLGASAGTVRGRDEDDEDQDAVNGNGGGSDTKWQRTG